MIDSLSQPQGNPKHVAIIMDGNGRWAKVRGLGRVLGHRNGVAAVRAAIESAAKMGIQYLTLYAFSTENWERPQNEVEALMSLLIDSIEKEEATLNQNQIKFVTIGNIEGLSKGVQRRIETITQSTSQNTKMTLVVAINYSGRWDIVNATKTICQKVNSGTLSIDEIDEKIIDSCLSTSQIPYPDLFIRTGGDMRLSNFLLWQIAYSELLFIDVYWPDFRKTHFEAAIEAFKLRERRFGKILDE
ncbi:MAG: isoprenyl transferase [Bacteroidales bacterium]